MSMKEDFKKFAMRGNVMDMAVGVIIGGAFGKIVSSLVNDVVMPPLGMALGKMDFQFVYQPQRQGICYAGGSKKGWCACARLRQLH